jgi:histidyl-tRNA synthetase
MRDMLPHDMERFRRIEDAFRSVCQGWGYDEIRTPTIEQMHLFTSAGTLSPQMLGRVYSFLDWDGWSGERVVLRPDSTIPTVRLFVENMAERTVAGLFYVQSVLRFEQGDANREDWQCGVELLGDSFPHGDVEVLLMACETLRRLDLTAEVSLSHPGVVRAILSEADMPEEDQLALYDRVLDGDVEALSAAEGRVPGVASIGQLLSGPGAGPEYVANLQGLLRDVSAAKGPLSELGLVSQMLADVGQTHTINPVLVRGFEYYTGPVYHLRADGVQVGAGGRYDNLAGLVGGRDVPASGFALEVDAIADLLQPETEDRTPVTIRCEGTGDLGRAFALALALRQGETSVRVAGEPEAGGSEVVVSDEEYVVSLNGAPSQRLREIDDVIRAVSGKA